MNPNCSYIVNLHGKQVSMSSSQTCNAPCWASLNQDLLGIVFGFLPCDALMYADTVCVAWHQCKAVYKVLTLDCERISTFLWRKCETTEVEYLHLTCNRCVQEEILEDRDRNTPEYLQIISSMTALRTLFLTRTPIYSLSGMRNMEQLRGLNLHEVPISSLAHMSSSLSEVGLSYLSIHSEELRFICALPNLKMLVIEKCPNIRNLDLLASGSVQILCLIELSIHDMDLRVNLRLPRLEGLRINRCNNLTSGGLENLQSCASRLKKLDLSYTGFDNLELLGALPMLNVLHVSMSPIVDSSFTYAKYLFPKLRDLDISYCQGLTSLALLHVAELSLTRLDMCGCNSISIMAIQGLRSHETLEKLDISDTDTSDTDLESVVTMMSLTKLSMQNCQEITNLCLKALSNMCRLQTLNLSQTPITDLAHLKLASLKELNVSFTNIKDSGLIVALSSMPSLNKLNLDYCKFITLDGFKRCSSMFPSTHIDIYLPIYDVF